MSRFLRFALLFPLFLLATSSAKADDYDVLDLYNVSGVLTIFGDNNCPPQPICAETIAFSFQMGVVQFSGQDLPNGGPSNVYGFVPYIVPDSVRVNSLGPLGSFFLSGGFVHYAEPFGPGDSRSDINWFPFYNAGADEIDIHLGLGIEPYPQPPTFTDPDLYHCTSEACFAAFSVSSAFNYGVIETTVEPVPEPGGALLLGGSALLGFFRRRRA
ncbi:MAG TPA: PEP-CTERM sorting domain-containing protein, partial [Dongiaceae bacterium]|nr:PEP-CTERM sorting domain-containing protein [Dongiaceae bacterium]